jgi:branched-chain amino acid transport system permease protein
MELFFNAIVSGLLLGGFYAAVALGLAIAFGQLDIVNIAHPAFVLVGSYVAYMVNSRSGLDPVLIGLMFTPVFYIVGAALYRIYYASFERTGQEALSGLAFFFGIMFIIEVLLIMIYRCACSCRSSPHCS